MVDSNVLGIKHMKKDYLIVTLQCIKFYLTKSDLTKTKIKELDKEQKNPIRTVNGKSDFPTLVFFFTILISS